MSETKANSTSRDLFHMMVDQIINLGIDELVIDCFFDCKSLDLMNESLHFINFLFDFNEKFMHKVMSNILSPSSIYLHIAKVILSHPLLKRINYLTNPDQNPSPEHHTHQGILSLANNF